MRRHDAGPGMEELREREQVAAAMNRYALALCPGTERAEAARVALEEVQAAIRVAGGVPRPVNADGDVVAASRGPRPGAGLPRPRSMVSGEDPR